MSVRVDLPDGVPVIITIQDQMVGTWIVEFGLQDAEQFLEVVLQSLVGPHLIKSCIGFQDMDMRVHRLRGIRLTIHAFQRCFRIIALKGFYITCFSLVVYFLF